MNSLNRLTLLSLAVMPLFLNAQSIFINEIDYDSVGTDNAEWIELAGVSGLSVNSSWSIEFFNGASGSVSYNTFALSSFTFSNESNGWGFYVIGIGGDYTPASWTVDEIQNGAPDMVVLRNGSDEIIQSIVYEGTKTDFVAVDGTDSNSIAGSIFQSTTGTTGFSGGASWTFGTSTPGGVNTGQTFLSPVPEPSTFAALAGIAVLGAASLRRRSR